MNSFSTAACYAALYACANDDTFHAYARMVSALIKKNRYTECDAKTLSNDFCSMYGFELPYHPMQAVVDSCIKLGYLTYNSSVHKCQPNYMVIDSEDFMDILDEKEQKYKNLLTDFGDFLVRTHNIYTSNEYLSELIEAFIYRYGVLSKIDKDILKSVKHDFLFAEYIISCEESGKSDVLDYLDEYTIGLSLSEVLTYHEKPETYRSGNTSVYLDTGLLFRLLGIDSANRTYGYKTFIDNMRRLGMHIKVYDHTLNELTGIIETAKSWIGNPNYDPALSSEAAYYFISNNWTTTQVDAFSFDIERRLKEEFQITIDRSPYPHVDDIHTIYEADIREKIVAQYKENNNDIKIEEIAYSIDQDARSLFMTQHKNGNYVSYHINDIKNIFITTNSSLAKVGCNISYDIAQSKEYFFPVAMNDIKWGTIIWFNSPTLISSINRPRLVSAAYAAFRPSVEVLRLLNNSLIKYLKSGDITPEQCYFLKTSPVAQRLLAKKTQNESEQYIESTPLDILKEIEEAAFSKGNQSRQQELNELDEAKKHAESNLTIEKQKNRISECEHNCSTICSEIEHQKQRMTSAAEKAEKLEKTQEKLEIKVRKKCKTARVIVTILVLALICLSIVVAYKWSWLISLWSIVPSLLLIVFVLWEHEFKLASLMPTLEKHWRNQLYVLYIFSPDDLISACKDKEDISKQIEQSEKKLRDAENSLKIEKSKLDEFSCQRRSEMTRNAGHPTAEISAVGTSLQF